MGTKKFGILISTVLLVVVGCPPPSFSQGIQRGSQSVVASYNHSLVFLILGVDSHNEDTIGRSDAIFLVTVNPHKKSLMLTNIPRDTYVNIPGKSRNRLSHSYKLGGERLIRKTVEKLLKLPIDGYVKIDMPVLRDVVDRIGGVEVNVPFSFTYKGFRFHKGKLKMSGEQALAYCRMRKQDPEGELGRNKRHQQVMKAMIKRGTSPYVMVHIVPIAQEVMKKVSTDIPTFTILQLAYMYHDVSMSQVVTNRLKGSGTLVNGVHYYFVEQDEVSRVRDMIKTYKQQGQPWEG